ncbi:MAG: hypothetical protein IPK50_04615 [Fibrobacterota bacterium]|nr:hypothetical protein [Fibrobacterota bacterium]QQS06178.1 MAG: hypothetical protein IPK50_04615 [Fibrobacterota bacterium]
MFTSIALSVVALATARTTPSFGRVCVAHLPEAVTADFYRTVGAQRYPVGDVLHPPLVGSEFQVDIDARPPIPVGVKIAQWMDSLAMDTKHSVRIRFHKKPATAFRFRFGQYKSADLCLYYKWDYDTWVLTEKKGKALGCDCP